MAEKTSLQKSHSKASNAKLTLICLLTALFSTGIFAGSALIAVLGDKFYIGTIVLVVSAILSVLCVEALGKFTR